MENKTITIMLGMILLISSASALTIVAGNQEIITLDVSPSSCMIIDSQNNSLLNYTFDGLNFTIDGNKITINTNPALKPDNYTLFCDYSWTEEDGSGSSGGGSSGDGGCATTWTCGNWGSCVDGERSRTCSKLISYCGAKNKPVEIESCEVVIDEDEYPDEIVEPEDENNTKRNIIIGVIIIVVFFIIVKIVEATIIKDME